MIRKGFIMIVSKFKCNKCKFSRCNSKYGPLFRLRQRVSCQIVIYIPKHKNNYVNIRYINPA